MATAARLPERPTRALMIRHFDGATLDAMYAAARARGLTMRQYVATLYELHEQVREYLDNFPADEMQDLRARVRELGLLSVSR